MPFRGQTPYYAKGTFATYEASEERAWPSWTAGKSGLYWRLVEADSPRDATLPLIDRQGIADIEGYVTDAEAEAATGLSAPVCFDYIRDRMGYHT